MDKVGFFSSSFWMFLKPRTTVRRILDQKPGYGVWFFILVDSLMEAWDPSYAFGFNVWLENMGEALAATLVLMTLFNVAKDWIEILFQFLIGRALGGKANLKEAATAYVWSFPPGFIGYLIYRLMDAPKWFQILKGEDPTQSSDYFTMLPIFDLIKLVFLLVCLAFLVWSVVLVVLTVAEAQRFSGWKSFVTVIFAMLPLFAIDYALKAGFPLLFILK